MGVISVGEFLESGGRTPRVKVKKGNATGRE